MKVQMSERATGLNVAVALREACRRAGLGRMRYRIFHASFPRLRWRLQFGVKGALHYACGEAAMKRAARRLTPINACAPEGFACTFMTGGDYWHQTMFCAHSLGRRFGGRLRATIYEDGTLTPAQRKAIQTVLSGVNMVGPVENIARLDTALPRDRYPRLRAARDTMPMMRKLVDPRAGNASWQLYLDSDMLFLRRPDFLVACARQRVACHMLDRIHAYTLPDDELARITGVTPPARVNAGIVGLDDARIDWDAVERWLGDLPPAALEPRLLEQTLTALLLGRQHSEGAPGGDYHILYDSLSSEPPGAVLLHFIYHAKLRYFTKDWRRYIAQAGTHSP